MQAEEILDIARNENDIPHGWVIFSLLRHRVVIGIVGWTLALLIGAVLFTFFALLAIPVNYQRGTVAAIITTIVFVILLFIPLGSLWSLIIDVLRLSRAREHLLVITPTDFVKQEGAKIIHVPFADMRFVTVRGARPLDRSQGTQVAGVGETVVGFLLGRKLVSGSSTRSILNSRMTLGRHRTPTTVAFIDDRTEREVVVVTDKSYGDPFAISTIMKQYAASARQQTPAESSHNRRSSRA